jgi:flagellar basal-body rod protein FlgG
MNYGLYLSASGVLTSMYRQDVYANNLANVQTAGFKPDMPSVCQRPAQSASPFASQLRTRLLDPMGGGAWAGPQTVDFQPGHLDQTGNPLDLALTQKNEFFVVGGTDGSLNAADRRLTRDGRLSRDASGQLMMAATNRPLLDRDNHPIVVSAGATVQIGSDGAVTQNGEEVGHLQVVAVDNLQTLTKEGNGLFRDAGPSQGEQALDSPGVQSGRIEGSAVDEVREMVAMMSAARDVNDNANLIHYQDQMMDQAINTFGRVA